MYTTLCQSTFQWIENIMTNLVLKQGSEVTYLDASKQYTSVQGYFPQMEQPHNVWQIDHTPVDLIIVDEVYRKPIGRPYLTLANDVYSQGRYRLPYKNL